MIAPTKINYKIYQGATFSELLRWESDVKVYAPITGITKSAPAVITSVGHGIPLGWRTKITNVVGMKEVNSIDNYHVITEVTADTITLNAVNTLSYTDYISGGVLEYNAPVDLAGLTARMQLRLKLDSAEIIHELTTENGGISINNTTKTIEFNISATATTEFGFTNCVYSMELVAAGNNVIPFISGNFTLIKEVTR